MGTEHEKVESVAGAVFQCIAGGIYFFASCCVMFFQGINNYSGQNNGLLWFTTFFMLFFGFGFILSGAFVWRGHLSHNQLFALSIADFVFSIFIMMSFAAKFLHESVSWLGIIIIPCVVIAGVFFITTPKPKRPSYTFNEPAPAPTPTPAPKK